MQTPLCGFTKDCTASLNEIKEKVKPNQFLISRMMQGELIEDLTRRIILIIRKDFKMLTITLNAFDVLDKLPASTREPIEQITAEELCTQMRKDQSEVDGYAGLVNNYALFKNFKMEVKDDHDLELTFKDMHFNQMQVISQYLAYSFSHLAIKHDETKNQISANVDYISAVYNILNSDEKINRKVDDKLA